MHIANHSAGWKTLPALFSHSHTGVRAEAGFRIAAKVTAIASMFLAMGALMAGAFIYFG
jgi:hypothetical protein